MNIIKNDKAETGIILFVILGIFIMGLVYVMFSPVMDENQKANNNLINDTTLPYTQQRADTMTGIYDYFKYFPLYMIILFVIWAIKRSIDKQSGVL